MNRRALKLVREPVSEETAGTRLPFDDEIWKTVCSSLRLAPQEIRVVELLMQGYQDKEIAQTLHLHVSTVRTYLTRVFQKAEVRGRMRLTMRIIALAEQARR